MLIIELYEDGKKVAEVPVDEIKAMSPARYKNFCRAQEILGRPEGSAVTPDLEVQEGKS